MTADAAPPYRVLVVEDDAPSRERIEEIVVASDALRLVGGYATRTDAIDALLIDRPDVALVDLDLPDGSGLDVIRAIGQNKLTTEAMVITVFDDENHVVAAIEAGATGYLLKDGSADDIAAAIVQLMNGGSPISPAIARHILRNVKPATRSPDGVSFTPRETEVLHLVAKGLSYTEIAATLSMSVHTATSHVKHIYRKLSVRSRGEAVFEAVQRGLIRIDSRG